MYYDICSSKKRKRGLKNVTQLFSRKIEISSSREKYAPTRSCGAFEGVKIHGFGLGSRQKSTQLRHSYRIEHFLRRFRRLPHRKTQLLKLNAILRGGVLAFLFSSVILPYLFKNSFAFGVLYLLYARPTSSTSNIPLKVARSLRLICTLFNSFHQSACSILSKFDDY